MRHEPAARSCSVRPLGSGFMALHELPIGWTEHRNPDAMPYFACEKLEHARQWIGYIEISAVSAGKQRRQAQLHLSDTRPSRFGFSVLRGRCTHAALQPGRAVCSEPVFSRMLVVFPWMLERIRLRRPSLVWASQSASSRRTPANRRSARFFRCQQFHDVQSLWLQGSTRAVSAGGQRRQAQLHQRDTRALQPSPVLD